MDRLRIDKWLWAGRFYKTRRLAVEEIEHGRVRVNEATVKPARELRVGDRVRLVQGNCVREVVVLGLSGQRGPAPVAQQLYVETAESVVAREQAAQQRRLAPEPALAQHDGRPTKRDRRALQRLAHAAGDDVDAWGRRWSASLP